MCSRMESCAIRDCFCNFHPYKILRASTNEFRSICRMTIFYRTYTISRYMEYQRSVIAFGVCVTVLTLDYFYACSPHACSKSLNDFPYYASDSLP